MIKVIQVGYGYWGESWVQYLRDDPNFELTALVVRTEETLAKAKEKWALPDSACFTDYDEALKLDAVLVIIVMPHYAHIEFAKKAVEAGKNVLIEKPLCDDMDEAKEFAMWMRGRKERVFVSHNYRYREELWRVRSGIEGGGLGELEFIELDYRAGMTTDPKEHIWNIQGWRGKQVCMQIYEVCIHHFDMFRFLTRSNAKSVYALGWNPEWAVTRGPESLFITIEFENGAKVQFSSHMSSVGAPTEFQGNWQIQCSKGLVTWLSGKGLDISPAADDPGKIPELGCGEFPGTDRKGVLHDLHLALGGEQTDLPTLEDNLNSLAIAAAVLLSAKEKRVVQLSEIL